MYTHLLCFVPKSSQIYMWMVCFILLFCSTPQFVGISQFILVIMTRNKSRSWNVKRHEKQKTVLYNHVSFTCNFVSTHLCIHPIRTSAWSLNQVWFSKCKNFYKIKNSAKQISEIININVYAGQASIGDF